MKYRSRMDIAADILSSAQNGSKKTKMMYNSMLSFGQLKAYLELLVESGLLKYSNEEKKYYTTESGRYFLKIYKELSQMVAIANTSTTTAATTTVVKAIPAVKMKDVTRPRV